jgi:putative acetyltransferase
MIDVTYRRAQNSDAEAIKNILITTFNEYEINLPENYSFADVENLEEQYLNKSGGFIVLLRQQQIIGFVALLPSDNNLIELKRLYLTANERGKGLGKYLLKMAIRLAKESGYYHVFLETTSKFVEAVALYQKFGFTEHVGVSIAREHDTGLILKL